MQNTGRSNFSRSSCQQSQNATPIGYACNVPNPKPYVAVTGCIGGGNANSNSGTCGVGTYQPANGAGAIRGYCSPLVRSAAPKPNGLESSVTKTNIATFVVSSHPNSAVRGLCLPVTVSENLNCSANRKQVDKFKSHFSVQQPFSAACASRLQANFAASSSDASCANTRSLAYRAPNVTQFPNEYLRTSYESMPSPPLPPRPTQWQHQQQQDQSDVLSLIDRFEKLNAFKNEFEIQSYDTTVSCDASVQPQLDRIDPTVCKPTTNCNSNGRVNDAKSWNTNYQAPAYSACNYDVVKPAQPVQCDREVSRTTANHVTFVSANVSRTAAPLASRPTNASDTSNYVYSRNNGNAACDYEYELRRIDCDSACSRRNVAMKRASASVVRTHYPPALFRLFMEQHVEHLFRLRQERLERRAQLEWEMAQMAFDETQKAGFRRMLTRRESEYTRLRRIKLSARDFDIIKMIGVGAFGKVFLVRKCASQAQAQAQAQAHSTLDKHKQKSSEPASTHTQLFAMKKLNKAELTRKNQLGHVKAERDILAESDNEWVVKLYYSFQDARYLYFILEYVPGGDLMSLLIRMGVFAENLARFYVAELILAVESVHAMRFIHRDIKPDNILICADGHLKLTDFGLCTGFRWTHSSKFYQTHIGDTKRTCAGDLDSVSDADRSKPKPKLLEERARSNERAREMRVAYSLVGTPNYIAPEILLRCGYTETVDWWSIGVILYEMLVGQPPFWAATPAATQYKVINHKSSLRLPADGRLSNAALSLIRALVRDPADRLGRNGADEIKAHAFFEPLRSVSPFQQLRHVRAPWQPVITHPTDTSNFDPIDEEALRMLSDEETEDNTRETYADGDRTLDLGLSFEQDAELDGDCALSEQRSASCETLKVIETEETANITLSSVLNVESDSDSGDLACKSVGLPNALDVTQTQCSDRANVPIGTVGKCKRMAKQITDESSVIPPAPYLDFTFRRFFDEPDTQRRANVQQGDHFEYTENFV